MGIIWFIIIGIVAGFLAGQIMKGKGFGLVTNLLVGVCGAIIGGWLFGELGIHLGSGLIGALLTALLGAIILLFVLSLIKKK